MSENFIQFQDLNKSFGSLKVLDGINLSIPRGQITSIIGGSGAGKSVLLKHLIGLMRPESGRILIDGRSLGNMNSATLRALKQKTSYMFQNLALFDSLTVFDNIALPLAESRQMPKADIRQRVEEKIQQLDLGDIAGKFPSQLSGGMRKRVAFARALINDPEIVLFDEPTTGLDPIRKNTVYEMIVRYKEQFGFTAVLVSHDIPAVFEFSQRVAMLDAGKIIYDGKSEDIVECEHPRVQQFIQGLSQPPETKDKGNDPHHV